MSPRAISIFLIFGLLASAATATLTPPDHPLFTGDEVHEIHLTFQQDGWWDLLRTNFEGMDDPLYLAAEFDWEAVHLDSIGVRFKGNSSYNSYPGVKKSFKLDIDEYVDGQTVYGLDKLNLNNMFMDPSFVRERCCYELCEAAGLPTVRTNFAALYINDEYWGLYTLIEQFDQEFIESRFGAGEAGNLWKGEHGTFEYLGPDAAPYRNGFELENNEEDDDWSALIDFTDILSNTPLADLPDSLHNRLDVNSALAMLAVDILTVNLDSYLGRGGNFYFYHRDLDSRLIFAKWDVNEAWGVFNMWGMSPSALQQLDPFWTTPLPNENRPLAERLWQIEAYGNIYLGHLRALMATAAEPDYLVARMEAMRDLIRPFVYDDSNKMFSNTEFENALSQNIFRGPRLIPALEVFVRARDTWLSGQIGEWDPIEELTVNEIMAGNNSTIADEFGEYDDWIEITNTAASPISLQGLGLVDHMDGSESFAFPDTILSPGSYLIVWADEQGEQGDFHAPFRLDADGEDVFLTDGSVIIQQVTFPSLGADISYGRWPDGTGTWRILSTATPGAENQNSIQPEEIDLCINELLAINESGIQDELGEYEDWLEICNPGTETVQMSGLFLTDDLNFPTRWMFPDTLLEPGAFLLVWCDSDPEDGLLHANFRLSGGGEEIGLFGRLSAGNEMIDSRVFGVQSTDISAGRLEDCGAGWGFFSDPTPGSSNEASGISDNGVVSPLSYHLYQNFPNPFNSETTISFNIPESAQVTLRIYDLLGREVAELMSQSVPAGSYSRSWNCPSCAAGIYWVSLQSNEHQLVRKITLLK